MERVWIVDSVRLNSHGEVGRVRWGMVNVSTGQWVRPPDEADVIDVVDVLLRGQSVATRTVTGAPGPKLRVVATKSGDGVQTVATIDRTITVADLAQF